MLRSGIFRKRFNQALQIMAIDQVVVSHRHLVQLVFISGAKMTQKSANFGTTRPAIFSNVSCNSSELARTLLASARKASRSCRRSASARAACSRISFVALFRLPSDLLGFFVEVDEDRDLRPQDFRHHRRQDVIDRA